MSGMESPIEARELCGCIVQIAGGMDFYCREQLGHQTPCNPDPQQVSLRLANVLGEASLTMNDMREALLYGESIL